MSKEKTPDKKGPAWDVIGTGAAISAYSFASEALQQAPDAMAITYSLVPAIAAGIFRKRFFAYSLLVGSAGWAAHDSFLPNLVMTPVAGTSLFAAMDKRLPRTKEDDGGEIH